MAGHAGLCWRHSRRGRFLHGAVTIAAVQAQLAYVMFVTEGNRLCSFVLHLGDVWREIDRIRHISRDNDQKNRAVDTDARDGVRAAMKDLSHAYWRGAPPHTAGKCACLEPAGAV